MSEQFGFLQVYVKTAGESLPVADAEVLVEGGAFSKTLFTDRSGKTVQLSLPAPEKSASLTAGGTDPFASYRVTVKKEGFYPQTTERVPVFSGVVSMQPITLIGLAEYGSDSLTPSESTDTVRENPQVLDR